MPVARPPQAPKLPAPLRPGEADYIRKTLKQYYADYAVVLKYGPNPSRLELHVETSTQPDIERYECLGYSCAKSIGFRSASKSRSAETGSGKRQDSVSARSSPLGALTAGRPERRSFSGRDGRDPANGEVPARHQGFELARKGRSPGVKL